MTALSQSWVGSSAASFNDSSTRILPTAIVRITGNDGTEREFRAMLDSCSQTSFITNDCVQKLGLKRRNSRIVIKGIGGVSAGCSKGVVTVCIRSRHDIYPQCDKITIQALILPTISSSLPNLAIKSGDRQWLEDIPLADPHFNISGNIDLLLGVDVFFHILEDGQMRAPEGNLVAQKTKFGWVVGGGSLVGSSKTVATYTTTIDIDAALRKFWELEEVTSTSESRMTPEEQNCVRYYQETTTRAQDGRFITRLPFIESTSGLSRTFNSALRCLESMEKRFERDPNLRRLYIEFLDEYELLGHMSKMNDVIDRSAYFMPHHGVLKQTSSTTKLRVVFNASAKCGGKKSLNQILLKGPTVQPSLHEIILKFRMFQYVLTGDIEKMFRQVLVHEHDQKHQLILWRRSPEEKIAAYQLKTVTYGTTSASFVTTNTLNQLAKQFEDTKPEAAKVIRQNFYVDDLMMGAESPKRLLKLKTEVMEILSSGGFKLRKFTTNDAALRKLLNSESDVSTKTLSDHPDAVRVLGIRWNPEDDAFMFTVDMPKTEKHTKRTFLSEISRIFDPHGWLSPLLIRPKMLLQSLWLCELQWDDELPVEVAKNWEAIRAEIVNAFTIRIPRWLEMTENLVLHGFCDASERAYASVIYVQSVKNGASIVNIVGDKTRVAPLKQRSLPQLELLGAQLLTNHMKVIMDQSGLCPREICFWTDSNIVLDWLSSHPGRWKTFVANRVSMILENYSRDIYRGRGMFQPNKIMPIVQREGYLLPSCWNFPYPVSYTESNDFL